MDMIPEQEFTNFISKIKYLTKIDLNLYKEAQMKRRLTALRDKKGFRNFDAYYHAIASDPSMLGEFLDRITINVSEFWRNANRWDIIEKKILPELLQSNRKIKCWSAACSTGEEPYTLAMIIDNIHGGFEGVQIVATDIDAEALEKAHKGVYIDRSVKEVPEKYLHKYFHLSNGYYHITNDLKKAVHFKKQNLLLDSFEQNYDLIICRNVLIYFTEEAKRRLYTKFAESLKPGGLLFVGSTEQIFSADEYNLEMAEAFLYRKKS